MDDAWETNGRLSTKERDELVLPFTEEEITKALKEMKNNTAPGPDGLSIEFYKAFWANIKHLFVEMFSKPYDDELELRRINYGLIWLIPKTTEANTIKPCRPLCCMLGMDDYKLHTKVLTNRLTKVADKIIIKIRLLLRPEDSYMMELLFCR